MTPNFKLNLLFQIVIKEHVISEKLEATPIEFLTFDTTFKMTKNKVKMDQYGDLVMYPKFT